jgi:hypothetical protein
MDGHVLTCDYYGCRTKAVMSGVTNAVHSGWTLSRIVRRHFAREGWTSNRRDPWTDALVDYCPDHVPNARW